MFKSFSVWGLVFLAAGCGYRAEGIRGGVPLPRPVAVPFFENDAAVPALSMSVTAATRGALLRRGFKVISDPTQSPTTLIGRITRYERTPLSLDEKGRAREYRVAITAAYVLREGERRSPSRQATGASEYRTRSDAATEQSAEERAIREAAERLAAQMADAIPFLSPLP